MKKEDRGHRQVAQKGDLMDAGERSHGGDYKMKWNKQIGQNQNMNTFGSIGGSCSYIKLHTKDVPRRPGFFC